MRVKRGRVYLISILIAFLVSLVIIFAGLVYERGQGEKSFKRLEERTCEKILNTGISKYLNLSENYEKDYNQFRGYISNMSAGINYYNDANMDGLVSSAFVYFDAEKRCLNVEDTFVLVQKKVVNGKNQRSYSFFYDESIGAKIKDIVEQKGDDSTKLYFELKDAYIKEDTFVPGKLSYYISDRKQSTSEVSDIYTSPKGKEEMEKDGYTYCEVDTSFQEGDISGDSELSVYPLYYGEIDSDVKSKVMDFVTDNMDKADKVQDNCIFVKKDKGLKSTEFFSMKKMTTADDSNAFYAVTYNEQSLLHMVVSSMISGGFFLHILIIVLLIAADYIIAIVAAGKYIKKKESGV